MENEKLTVELISVGTELLLGNIVNTNAVYLSKQCARLGLMMYRQAVVGDNPERLEQAMREAAERADIVILTGGLGPTQDDLTKEIAAKIAEAPLVEDAEAKKVVEDFFAARKAKKSDITENNWKQALIPKGSKVLPNENGTAPGLIVKCKKKTRLILLPGPPGEMIPMFEKYVYGYLQNRQTGVIYSRMVKLCGVGESKVETQIRDLIDAQTNPTIATYAKVGEVDLRVTAYAEDEKSAKKLVKPMVTELKRRFGYHIFSTKEEESLEASVVTLLADMQYMIATAESCTGGKLASRIVDVPGASVVFKQGYITYSNKSKHKLLGVSKSLMRKYGAVSESVAAEMAKGAAEVADAAVGVGITGIAGPDGGTEEKPVGTVFIGCCVNGDVTVKEYHFEGDRDKVRESSTVYALVQLRECILSRPR